MRLEKTDVVAGLPAPVAVKFLKHFVHDSYAVTWDKPRLDATYGTETEALKRLEQAGLVRRKRVGKTDGDIEWTTTTDGNAMSMVKFTPPITRATADRLLAGAIERAAAFNADPSKLATILRIRVFGSYLDPAEDRPADLDLAVSVLRKRRVEAKEAQEYARVTGKRGDWFSILMWPGQEPYSVIKNRSRATSVTAENPALLTTRWTDVFVADGVVPNPIGAPNDDSRPDW